MGQRARRQRRVEFPAGLGRGDQFGELVTALAYIMAHRPGDVLVPAGGDQRLDDEIAARIEAAGEQPADAQEDLSNRSRVSSAVTPAIRPMALIK